MTQNNSQSNYDQSQVQQKLEELEAQVYQTAKETTTSNSQNSSSFSQQIGAGIKTVRNWFDNLPQVGKLIVGVVAILIGFSILNLFLRLIANIITLAILSLILYGLYKYLFPNPQSK